MRRNQFFMIILVGVSMLVGCSSEGGDTNFVNVESEDAEMNAAIETAKETFTFFVENWKTMDNDGYSVKFAMPTSDGDLEHIWFSPTRIEGGKVTGECANDPVDIPGLSIDDERTVDISDVSDWMIMDGAKCYGGYTIRVLSERNPDAAPPFEFVDPPKR